MNPKDVREGAPREGGVGPVGALNGTSPSAGKPEKFERHWLTPENAEIKNCVNMKRNGCLENPQMFKQKIRNNLQILVGLTLRKSL